MPRRKPLATLPVNRLPNHELSDDTKQRLYGRALAGQSTRQIAAEEQLQEVTVYHAINRISKRQTIADTPRSGRSQVYTARDERMILRVARQNPKLTYNELKQETGLDLNHDTILRILRNAGMINWCSKKRPKLTQHYANLRLQFARQWIHHTWINVIFSDECSVEKGTGKSRVWSFGYPHQKWDYNKIEEYPKGKQGSVMVWAAIAPTFGRSELIIMKRDERSLHQGYSATSYINTLREGLVPTYNGETYMHTYGQG
jgi:transposase